jgi:transcriptional regulator with XRE-family HTH domain
MPNRIKRTEAAAIGARLRHARISQGLTLVQVARGSGCDHTRISKIERGQFAVVNEQVRRICTFVRFDPNIPDVLSASALHARLDGLLAVKPAAAAAVLVFFDALDQMAC